MENLIKKAQELGIQDAENLTEPKLKAAIRVAENAAKALQNLLDLQKQASELGLDTDGVSAEDLETAIKEEVQSRVEELEKEQAAEILQAKIKVIQDYFEIEDFHALSPLELLDAITPKTQELIVNGAQVISEGKTDETFESSKGKIYGFSEGAPAAFRYMGILRTQKEWISDKDAMELMIAGNLSYLTIKN